MRNYCLQLVTRTVGASTAATNEHGASLCKSKLEVAVDQAPSRCEYPPRSYYYTIAVVDWLTTKGLNKLYPSNLYKQNRLAGWNVTCGSYQIKKKENDQN